MEGIGLAARREFDKNVSLAWHTAAFGGAAQAGKLKPLEKYLTRQKPVQSPDDMLKTLEVLQEMGAPMTIRQVN